MSKVLLYTLILIFSFFTKAFCFVEPPLFIGKKSSNARAHTRFSIAPVVSFYKINKNHASNAKQKMSALVSLKEEWRLTEKYNFFFLLGIEYMIHGVNFDSYYFKPDSLQLYGGNMNYKYSLYIHEIDIPLQVKFSFNRENNSLYSPYCMLGYHFRTLIGGNLKVTKDGETIDRKGEDITFKNKLIDKHCNPFVSLTVGIQKNNPNSSKNCFFAEVSYRYGFSPYLLKDDFTPTSLYINSDHLSLGLGVKF